MSIDLEPMHFETPGEWTVQIRVPSGSVTIHTHDEPTTDVHISGVKSPDDLVVTNTERSNQLLIAQSHKTGFGRRGARLHIELVVPRGTGLRVKGPSVDIACDGTLGSVDLSTASGDAQLATIHGDLQVATASGDTDVEHVTGRVNVRSASGDIVLGQVDREVNIASASGDLRVECLRAAKTSVKLVSGDVDLAVERGHRVYLDLSSVSGTTRPQLDLRPDGPSSDAPAEMQVSVRTVSGDIFVRSSDRPAGLCGL